LELRQEVFDRFGGSAETLLYFAGAQVMHDYNKGAWDSALSRIDEALQASAAAGMFVREVIMRIWRAAILSARDPQYDPRSDIHDALSVDGAADAGDILRLDALVPAAETLALVGARDEAMRFWEEVRAGGMSGRSPLQYDRTLIFAWTAVHLGQEAAALGGLTHTRGGPWRDVAQAIIQHDFAAAVAMQTEMGHVLGIAQAGLFAGGDHRRRALEFFRSIGATRYVAMGEAALQRDSGAQ
jgi:hypothetical protein